MLEHPSALAVGETGLDFNRNFSPPQAQVAAFEAQLDIATEFHKPLFLHERDAFDRQYQILASRAQHLPPTVIHCFTGSDQALRHYLDLGFYIGITGWLCDQKRGKLLRELVSQIPQERLMIETDAPYLLPRKTASAKALPSSQRNEPSTLPEVLKTLASCRGQSPVDLDRQIIQNSCEFFGLSAQQR